MFVAISLMRQLIKCLGKGSGRAEAPLLGECSLGERPCTDQFLASSANCYTRSASRMSRVESNAFDFSSRRERSTGNQNIEDKQILWRLFGVQTHLDESEVHWMSFLD